MCRCDPQHDPSLTWKEVVVGLGASQKQMPLQLASACPPQILSGAPFHRPLCILSPTLEPADDHSYQTYSAAELNVIVNQKLRPAADDLTKIIATTIGVPKPDQHCTSIHHRRRYIRKTLFFNLLPSFVPINMRRSRAHSRQLFTTALDPRSFALEAPSASGRRTDGRKRVLGVPPRA